MSAIAFFVLAFVAFVPVAIKCVADKDRRSYDATARTCGLLASAAYIALSQLGIVR